MKKDLPSEKDKRTQKHLLLPNELIADIETTQLVGKYLDFTTKVILLLEKSLTQMSDEAKKKDYSNPSSVSEKPKRLRKAS